MIPLGIAAETRMVTGPLDLTAKVGPGSSGGFSFFVFGTLPSVDFVVVGTLSKPERKEVWCNMLQYLLLLDELQLSAIWPGFKQLWQQFK